MTYFQRDRGKAGGTASRSIFLIFCCFLWFFVHESIVILTRFCKKKAILRSFCRFVVKTSLNCVDYLAGDPIQIPTLSRYHKCLKNTSAPRSQISIFFWLLPLKIARKKAKNSPSGGLIVRRWLRTATYKKKNYKKKYRPKQTNFPPRLTPPPP